MSDADTSDIVDANKPDVSESFVDVLTQIVTSLNQEASDLGVSRLTFIDDNDKAAGGEAQ